MLISKDENIKTSSVYVASLILKQFQSKKALKLSIFEISENLKKYKIVHYRHILFGLTFLYSTNIIDFREPYFYLTND
ncbi:MAG: ABC-three component system middle component 6 [Chitinophagales bacterium]